MVVDIAAHQNHVTTGFVGTALVFQGLGKYQRNDVAVAIAQRIDYPSFGCMVNQGPGTIWEKRDNSSALPRDDSGRGEGDDPAAAAGRRAVAGARERPDD